MNNASIIIFAVCVGLISVAATRKEKDEPIAETVIDYNYQPPAKDLPDYAELQYGRDWLKRETDSLRNENKKLDSLAILKKGKKAGKMVADN